MSENNFYQPCPHNTADAVNDCTQENYADILSPEELAALADLEAECRPDYEAEQKAVWDAYFEKEREALRQKFEPYLLSAYDQIPPMIPVVKRHDSLICSQGNISAVVGEAKSKKTFLCTAIVGSMLDINERKQFGIQPNRGRIVWIDTEQSREHIQRLLFRINVMGNIPHTSPNPYIRLLAVREEKPQERLNIMRYAIEYYKPKLVVIDGISDLLNNPNNLEESEALVSSLLTLSSDYGCHIMSVLHTNPNSDKARGHLGSTLMRKAETVVYVHKAGDISYVEPQFCRNMPFERFAFRVEEAEDAEFLDPAVVGLGVPVECPIEEVEESKREDDCVRVLREYFGGVAERKLLCNKLEDILGVTPSYARTKVCRAIERGLLIDRDRTITIAPVC
ncbi:MAG: AAA family ATPase [Alistipes sp.]|nr:AAA family ATPase [Alistipes sp.]